MRTFWYVLTFILMLVCCGATTPSNAQICIGNNCTDSDHVGSMEMRQFNGRVESCVGSGCDDLGISKSHSNSLLQGEADRGLQFHRYGQSKYALPIPVVEDNVKCEDGVPAMMKRCYAEVWYQARNSDLVSDVSRVSGCSEQDIIKAVKKRQPGQNEILICIRQL